MSRREQEPDNIIKHPFRYPVTFVTVVFALILIYFIVQGIIVLKRNGIRAYNIGAVQSDNVTGNFTGMVLRSETPKGSDRSGFVNYFAVSGDRLSKDDLIAVIDEKGDMEERLHQVFYGQDTISTDSRREIQEAVQNASTLFDNDDLSSMDRMRSGIRAAVFECLLRDSGDDLFLKKEAGYLPIYSDQSGFYLFWRDGLEGKQVSELTSADFTAENYILEKRAAGDPVEAGTFLYKIAYDNRFRLVFLLSDKELETYYDRKTLSVRMEDGLEITGSFSVQTTADGKNAGVLEFAKYGLNYMDSRFVSFQILDKSVSGYKIPESAIVKKNFFVVDEAFITQGGAGSANGVLVQDGDSAKFVPATVYFRSDDESANFIIGEHTAYLYSEALSAGAVLIRPDSADASDVPATASLGVTASVEGVYQINQGYCIFKPIVRLKNSLDTSYVMISSRVRAGLQPFDRIVLDAAGTGENEIIFE